MPIDGKNLNKTQALGTLLVNGQPVSKHTTDWEQHALAALDDPSQPTVQYQPGMITLTAPYVQASEPVPEPIPEPIPEPLPSGVIFHSNWSTATGTSSSALRDTNKPYPWDAVKGNPGSTEVVSVASLGLRSPGFSNCLLIRSNDNASEGVRMTSLPELGIGVMRSYRMYGAVLLPDDATFSDQSFHPLDIRNNQNDSHTCKPNVIIGQNPRCPGVWFWQIANINGTGLEFGQGTYGLGRSLSASEHPLGQGRAPSIGLAKNVFWGLEFHLLRTSGTHYRLENAWVYDDRGNTVHDSGDFYQANNDVVSLAVSKVDWRIDHPSDFTWLNCGINGFPSGYPVANVLAWAAVTVGDNIGQIGPYGA